MCVEAAGSEFGQCQSIRSRDQYSRFTPTQGDHHETIVAPLFAALLFALPSTAAEGTKDGGKIVVEGTKVVELADGGEIVVDKAGKTYHSDAKGKRVRMKS